MNKVEVQSYYHGIWHDQPLDLSNCPDIDKWKRTDKGKFVLVNTKAPLEAVLDNSDGTAILGMCNRYRIYAQFDDKTMIYWKLKYE